MERTYRVHPAMRAGAYRYAQEQRRQRLRNTAGALGLYLVFLGVGLLWAAGII